MKRLFVTLAFLAFVVKSFNSRHNKYRERKETELTS